MEKALSSLMSPLIRVCSCLLPCWPIPALIRLSSVSNTDLEMIWMVPPAEPLA